ncbi:hypothetical protein N8I74_09720 [Chitiniphilus purpureus]|uniref:DUF4440 domain-containing protein n=1 Tax=Chitiniphilus purpureus TaxID=2981137 RepID=A0ABY6DSB4_9NEIS|nr:hypothetical protein [Chitiniphilus sp. CD1]UXY17264.1 hypothetical protein N8I74_09720 [Chitiniphilus sp. CD1]
MKNACIAFLLALIAPVASYADDFATLADVRKAADRAIALFREEKFVEGYDSLKPYWPLPAVEVDNMANQTSVQWPLVRQRFGLSIGTEFVSQVEGGPSLARLVYLQKFQRHALRWVFTFYKPKDRWVINSVSFDDQIQLLFP